MSSTRRAKTEVRRPKTGLQKAAATLALLLLPAGGAVGQEKKKEEPPPVPKILYFTPIAVAPGAKVKVTARGLNLDLASAVEIPGAEVSIKGKSKVTLKDNADPELLGNSQVEVELKIPADAKDGELEVKLTNPAGTATQSLRVLAAALAEKEPNNGFAQAQPLEAGKTLLGRVDGPKDVDVFRVEGKKGEVWSFSARRCGSPLDPLLTLYSAAGHVLASQDDAGKERDAKIEVALPADGAYYLALLDAHDAGGNTHGYLLTVERR